MSDTILEYQYFAPFYREIGQKRGHFVFQSDFVEKILRDKFPVGGKILDAACGTGDVLKNLAMRLPAFEFYGTDGCNQFVDIAKTVIGNNAVYLRSSDWLKLENIFSKSMFDCIFILGNSIAHASSFEVFSKILHIVNGLLKNGGLFLFDLRTWQLNSSFNEPSSDKYLHLSDDIIYKTDYRMENSRHCLVHQLYKNNRTIHTTRLNFLDHTESRVERLITRQGFTIEKKYDNHDDYPFLAYQIKKCN